MSCVDVNYKAIGLRVRTFRHQHQLTQEQLAERAGISKQFLSSLERGNAVPSVDTVLSLCDALSISSNDLLNFCAVHNPDAACTLRDDHSIFTDTLDARFFPDDHTVEIRISLDDLPAYDILLPDSL